MSTCLCRWITPVDNWTEVLILQHPLEARQAKGSAPLLHRSLARSQLCTGEHFDAALLGLDDGGSALLYPETAGHPAAPFSTGLPRRLVVLDGTWRKSRKLLHLNPVLQRLPRFALTAPPPSRYTVRKAHRPDQLSTLEATCLALAQFEQAPERYAPLLAAFGAFVSHLAATATAGTASAEVSEGGNEV